MLTGFALFTILLACLGFLFICCKSRCYACVYGLLLLPAWLAVVAVGITGTLFSTLSKEILEENCKKYMLDNGDLDTVEVGSSTVNINLDIYESLYVNSHMCSSDCPCEPVPKMTEWLTAEPARTNYDFTGTYRTYRACVEESAKLQNVNAGIRFMGFADGVTGQEDYETINEWIEFFEDEYTCAGVCEPALFYWSKSIALGLPSTSCLQSISESLTNAF